MFNLKLILLFGSIFQLAIGDELVDLANSTRNTLKLYDQNNDDSIPWKNLTKFVEILNIDMQDYSRDAIGSVIHIRDFTRRGLDIYFEQTRKVYGWAVSAELNFKGYLRVNELLKYNDTTVILNVLSNGVEVLTEAIDKMDDIADYFSNATMHVERLEAQLQKDKQSNSTYLREKMVNYRVNSALVGTGIGIFIGLLSAVAVTDGSNDKDNAAAAAILAGSTATGAGASYTFNEFVILNNMKERLAAVERIYSDFKVHTSQVFQSITNSKQKLREELMKMEAFKNKVEGGRTQFIFLPFVKEVHGPIISDLATECADYVKRHGS